VASSPALAVSNRLLVSLACYLHGCLYTYIYACVLGFDGRQLPASQSHRNTDKSRVKVMMSNNQRIVCSRCAKIKQACSGEIPCSRCSRLQVDCEPSQNGATDNVDVSSKPVRITRTHTGCASCKKRKRKCDELLPKCTDCRRLCLDCHYPHQTIKKRQSPANSTSTTTIDSQDAADNLEAQPLAVTTSGDGELDFNVEGLEDAESWWPFSPTFEPVVSSPTSNASTLSLTQLHAAPALVAEEDKSLLNHYIKVVAVVLSRRDDHQSNPYLSKMLTVAFSDQLVMDALLALSANHWKKMQPSVWKRGILHQTNALQSLGKLLPQIDSHTADTALAATLLLAMIELFEGTSSHWKFHLDGVRRLLAAIEAQPQWNAQSQHRAFYRQLYHFLDSATTISTCHPPLLESPKEQDVTSPTYDHDDEAALYGIPRSLFHFVDKLNGLAYQRKFRDDPVFESMFQASASKLQEEIEQWSEEKKEPVTGKPSPEQHATTAFEQALRLRLHQIVNGYSLDHPAVRTCVGNILDAVQEIRYGSPIESSLVFPLVMAGGACEDEHSTRIVQDRFLVMERTLGFRYVYTAHSLIERVWKEREAVRGTDQEVNWAAIRYFNIPGLAFV
jgi:transcriptional activator protein UGA3